ncbi:STM4014 family protein [Deinococcus lacus]|uniref:STM4014 family protein n=1 Tax=Deinococcus lacus TaxID=392561 RepID=A0ABW1YFT6_9DEIO
MVRGLFRFAAAAGRATDRVPPHRPMQRVGDILTMFDKPATHARLRAAGVSVPDALPEVHSAAELFAAARERGWTRLFVKLAYGSSASGAVALQWQGERVAAISTVRMLGGRLYNSRQLLRYETWGEVYALLDALAPHRLHAEQWWPKASFGGRTIDLRVVTIGGRAQHTLVRSARGPITNLHLGNERGDAEALRRELGPRWEMVEDAAESALNAFPGALYAGVDVLLTPGFRRAAVLEVNAFGDYHRGVRVAGRDTYQAELCAMMEGDAPRP